MKYKAIIGFVLITLLVASVVIPAVSKQITANKGNILESNPKPGDSKWFATLRMDFGEEIYNDKICWLGWKPYYPVGRYYVHVDVNFTCPSNRKIEVNYLVKAVLYGDEQDIIFCNFEDSVTIINGSNPPDINEDYEKFCEVGYMGYWMVLRIKATLKEYKYYDGEWLLNSEDYTLKEEEANINFVKNKPRLLNLNSLILWLIKMRTTNMSLS